ncbi:MAG: type II toxin-antitoxin system PemK/MazF family toxin, partial [Ktedonobacteraceae bacterium]
MSSEAKAQSTPSPQENEVSQTLIPSPLPQNPRRGEIWDVNWSPGRGAEQKGTRPALIIQNDRGNTSSSYPLT